MRSFPFLLAFVFCLTFFSSSADAQLVENPDDFKVSVIWKGGVATEDGDHLAGDAKIILEYSPPSGPDISSVKVRLTGLRVSEKYVTSPDYADPPALWVDSPDNPTYFQLSVGPDGVVGSLLSLEIPWPTRLFHNGDHTLVAEIEVTVTFVNGQTQTLNYHSGFIPIIHNITIDDLTGVSPLPSTAALAIMGEPKNSDPIAPLAEPAFIWPNPQGGNKVFKCVINSALSSFIKIRYDIFSCDDPDTVVVSYDTTSGGGGLGGDGNLDPLINAWSWDGTKTVYEWDEFENYYAVQMPVERGLYQVRITADLLESDGEFGGFTVTDTDSTRAERSRWPISSIETGGLVYGPTIHPVYTEIHAGDKRKLQVNYALHLRNDLPYALPRIDAENARIEAFTRVYDGANGALERVAGPTNGAVAVGNGEIPYRYRTVVLDVPWDDKTQRAEKVLVTAKDKAGFDRGHRQKWNLGVTRKIIDGEAETVIYQVTHPATATQPEGLRRITNNQIVGGRCYVGMEFEFSPGAWLGNDLFRLNIGEDPDAIHSIEHPPLENHVSYLIASYDEYALSVSPYEGNPYINYAHRPHWQKWNWALEKWEDAAQGPQFHYSPRRERYRILIPWQTNAPMAWAENGSMPKLFDHNGPHTFKVRNVQSGSLLTQTSFDAQFACHEEQGNSIGHNYGMFYTIPIDHAEDKANPQNLVLKNVNATPGNGDYLKFCASDERVIWRQPQVKFTIADEGEEALRALHDSLYTPARYLWKVRLRSTDVDNEEWAGSYLISGVASGPGEVTAFVNTPLASGQTQVKDGLSDPNADPTAYAPIEEAGTYTFEISVEKLDSTPLDKVVYRSQKAFFPHYMPGFYPFRIGHDGEIRTGGDGIERYWVQYYVQDNTPNLPQGRVFNDLKIEMLPPGWEAPIAQSDENWGHTVKTPYFDNLLKEFDPDKRLGGTYITVFRAKDNHAADYRDHLDKPLLVKNDRINGTPDIINNDNEIPDEVAANGAVTPGKPITRKSDKVVSARKLEDGMPGGEKWLWIKIWPPGQKMFLRIKRKAGHENESGSAEFGDPISKTPLGPTQVIQGQVGADGEPKPQKILILGRDLSTTARNMEIKISNVNPDGTEDTIHKFTDTKPPTYQDGDGTPKPGNWEFTVFRVVVTPSLAGLIDDTPDGTNKILPDNAKAYGGTGGEGGGFESLNHYYKTLSSNNDGDLGETALPKGQTTMLNSVYGGIVFQGQIQPKDIVPSDFNSEHSLHTSFYWRQIISGRAYILDDCLRNISPFSGNVNYIASDGMIDAYMPPNAPYYVADNAAADNVADLDKNIPGLNQKDGFLYVWYYDRPSIKSDAVPVGLTLHKRANFQTQLLYAKTEVSTLIPWYWRSSLKKEDNQVIVDTSYQGDNQIAIGQTQLTHDLQAAQPSFSLDTVSFSLNGQPLENNTVSLQAGGAGVTVGATLTGHILATQTPCNFALNKPIIYLVRSAYASQSSSIPYVTVAQIISLENVQCAINNQQPNGDTYIISGTFTVPNDTLSGPYDLKVFSGHTVGKTTGALNVRLQGQ